ncbi:MAG: GntR family transcriptional regulator [Oscillospiraceae bacterium]|nr:GntR family transcriptional regulator [Oscillospiraceae bacterium]
MNFTEKWREFDSSSPIYGQIIVNFERAIVRGEIDAGARIPSIRELSGKLKVNTNTVQRAYQEMERSELIYSQRGTGYFVMNNKEITNSVREKMVSQTVKVFLEEMYALGFNNQEIEGEIVKAIKANSNENGGQKHEQ